MITCTQQQTLVNSRPSYMQLARFIIECKKFDQYHLANKAFVCLLRQSINSSVHIFWESENDYSKSSYKEVISKCYDDLVVLFNGRLKVNLPCPLIKPRFMELTYYQAEKVVIPPKDRWEHNRTLLPCLPGQVNYLKAKLAKLVPNYEQIADIYLAPRP